MLTFTRITFLTKITCVLIAIASLTACKKAGSPAGPGNNRGPAYFFANTEWTGTIHTVSEEYDQPCYLRFNGDTTVSVYSSFIWILGGVAQYVDSTVGHITKIDESGAATIIAVTFPQSGDQQEYSITGQNTLLGGSTAASTANVDNTFNPSLQRCPPTTASVAGTFWSSKKMVGGPTDGMYAYPDVQTFSFNDNNTTTYYRNGHIITYTPTDRLQILLEEYNQHGPMINFAGFNEEQDLLMGYFGVLTPDGKSMLVNSYASYRLPNYTQTIYWYGPPGVTPVIFKQ
jgi:hypothetical protein